MKNIKVNKMVAGLLVGTNLLVTGSLAGDLVKNERFDTQRKIMSTIEDNDIKEYYKTEDESIKRLSDLKTQTTVLSSNINNGTFKITQDIVKEECLNGRDVRELAKELKHQLEKDGAVFKKATHSKKMIKSLDSSNIISKNSKVFKANTKAEINELVTKYIEQLKNNASSKNKNNKYYSIDYNLEVNPMYAKNKEDLSYIHIYNTEAEANQYVLNKINEGYDVNYNINNITTVNGSDVEYEHIYERDTAHGLLFDNDQALVYSIGHPDPRPDLALQGYVITDVNFEPVYYRWNTKTYDVVYTYTRPIVKQNTNTKYELVAHLTKNSDILGYIGQLKYNLKEDIYKDTLKEVVDVYGTLTKQFNGSELNAEFMLDEFMQVLDPHVVDKMLPKYDIDEFLDKMGEFPDIDDPDIDEDDLIPHFKSLHPQLPTVSQKDTESKPMGQPQEVTIPDENVPLANSYGVHTGDKSDLNTALLAFLTGLSALGVSTKKKEKVKTK